LDIPRHKKYGGFLNFDTYQSLRDSYVKGEIHPSDLKTAIAHAITDILKPVRDYFRKNPNPLEEIRRYDVIK
jgi:tyrosyl-tRNA synthetase